MRQRVGWLLNHDVISVCFSHIHPRSSIYKAHQVTYREKSKIKLHAIFIEFIVLDLVQLRFKETCIYSSPKFNFMPRNLAPEPSPDKL